MKSEMENKNRKDVEKELIAHLLKRFGQWQLPDKFLFVKEIPRTSTGKFAKRELRE